MLERVDRRVLAALRFVEAEDGAPVLAPLVVRGEGVTLRPLPGGRFAVTSARGFEDLASAFEHPSELPATKRFSIEVSDPSGRFVPRRFELVLPRAPTLSADGAVSAESLFAPIDVRLYPAAGARVSVSAAEVRVVVTDAAGKPVPGALVRVTRADGSTIARGVAWLVGRAEAAVSEALIPVAGLPRMTTAGGDMDRSDSVFTSDVPVQVVAGARATPWPRAAAIEDPDALDRDWGTAGVARSAPESLALRPGARGRATVTIPL